MFHDTNLNERRIYPFNKGLRIYEGGTTPFRHAKNVYFYLEYGVETLQVGEISFSRLALKNFQDHVVYSTSQGDVNDVIGKRHLLMTVFL